MFDEKVYLRNADKIHDAYIKLKELFPDRVHLIDGTEDPKQILQNVIEIINDYIHTHE